MPPPPLFNSFTIAKKTPPSPSVMQRKISSIFCCTVLIRLILETKKWKPASLVAWSDGCQLTVLTHQSTTLASPDGPSVFGTKLTSNLLHFIVSRINVRSHTVNYWRLIYEGWNFPVVNCFEWCEVYSRAGSSFRHLIYWSWIQHIMWFKIYHRPLTIEILYRCVRDGYCAWFSL